MTLGEAEVSLTPSGSRTVLYQGRALYSPRDPLKTAERAFIEPQAATLYVCPSPLLGYGLERLAKRLPESAALIAFDINAELEAVSARFAPIWQNNRARYVPKADEAALNSALEALSAHRFQEIKLIAFSGGYALDKTRFDRLFGFCCRFLHNLKQNAATLRHFGRRWYTNIIRNFNAFSCQGGLSLGQSADPVLAVGAGESLEACMPLLKACRARYRLFAVDTALPALLACGLSPDAVFAIEGGYANINDFFSGGGCPVPLAADIAVYPGVARLQKTRFFSSSFDSSALLKRVQAYSSLPVIPPLGSVGVAVCALALQYTSGPVICCGLDFGFSLGKTHAKGSYAHTAMLNGWSRLRPNAMLAGQLQRPLLRGATDKGAPVLSDPVLAGYAGSVRLAQNPRLFRLPSQGLALGLPEISLAALPRLPQPFGLPSARKALNARAFIENELQLLESWQRAAAAPLLAQLDYLYRGCETPSSLAEAQNCLQLRQRAQSYHKEWQAALAKARA